MPTLSADTVREAALQLTLQERAQLAADLLDSLPPPQLPTEEEVADILARRIEEIDSGKVTMIPWEEVRQGLHRET